MTPGRTTVVTHGKQEVMQSDAGPSGLGHGGVRQPDRHQDEFKRVEALAMWMDRRYVDPLLGFVLPGLGDVLGAAVGLYIVNLARRMGFPKVVLARMLVNISLDALVGAVPLLGAVFDVFYRSNLRNLALMRQRSTGPAKASPGDWAFVVGAVALTLAALALPIVALVLVLRALL